MDQVRPISGLRMKKSGRETGFDRSGYFSLVEELSSAKALRIQREHGRSRSNDMGIRHLPVQGFSPKTPISGIDRG